MVWRPYLTRSFVPLCGLRASVVNRTRELDGLCDLEWLVAERPAVLAGNEGVGVDNLALDAGDDEVDRPGPGALLVEDRPPRRVIGVGVVVAEDVLAGVVRLALGAA